MTSVNIWRRAGASPESVKGNIMNEEEMANLHSAGATVRHKSPFDSLPTHRNDSGLSGDFIKKWAAPFYMRIASYLDDTWPESIKELKNEITPEICLKLLGDFNWRTRLVGAYFSAVKGYSQFIDIIGTHLLKSEVCCVGHIYALTLTFFRTKESEEFLNKYLNYYLTTPGLYFDQKSVMEAILYLDKVSGTSNFERHLKNWKSFLEKRKAPEREHANDLSELLKKHGENISVDELLNQTNSEDKTQLFSTEYFDKQIDILTDLNKYCR